MVKLIGKEVSVSFDDVDGSYTVMITTDRDGTIFAEKANNLSELLKVISKITKTRFVLK